MTLASHWQLRTDLDFLNHGSFGACPTIVLETQRRLQDALERDPIRFLAPERDLEAKLDHVRSEMSKLVNPPAADQIAFVRNATDGVNAVFRSISLGKDDEIVLTDHGYNACQNAARYAAQRCGARVRVARIPFPIANSCEVLTALENEFSSRTRLLLVDHVTSPTGLVFPIEQIIAAAHSFGIRVMVDGAHAPGIVPVDLRQLDADYYTANHHKWLCAPKSSGFLYVRPELQDEVRPTVISHAANRPRPGRSRFLAEFDWTGTFDPTPLLAVPEAIRFLGSLYPGGLDELMSANRRLALESRRLLCDALEIDAPSPETMIGSMVTVPLPPAAGWDGGLDPLHVALYDRHRFEIPVFPGPEPRTRLLRISLQAYNHLGQIERLADVLRSELRRIP